jgi:hypothetical protein
MADERKAIPLRISKPLWEALNRWASDDLRSLNGQIEFLLRESARKSGRLRGEDAEGAGGAGGGVGGAAPSPAESHAVAPRPDADGRPETQP